MDDIKIFANKWTRTGNLDSNQKNIQPGYRNGIWCLKTCKADNDLNDTMEGTELLNDEIIRIFREKEQFKSLGILELGTINQNERLTTKRLILKNENGSWNEVRQNSH